MCNKELERFLNKTKICSLIFLEYGFETLKGLLNPSHFYSKEEINALIFSNEWLFTVFLPRVSSLVHETLTSLDKGDEELCQKIKFIADWYSFISSFYASGNKALAGILLENRYFTPLEILSRLKPFKNASSIEAVRYLKRLLLEERIYSEEELSNIESMWLHLTDTVKLTEKFYQEKRTVLQTSKPVALENRIFLLLQLVSKSEEVLSEISDNFVDRGFLDIEKRNSRSFNRRVLKLSPHKKRELKFQENRIIKRRLVLTRRTQFDSLRRFSQLLSESRILNRTDESNSPFVKGAVSGILRRKFRQQTLEVHNKWLHHRYMSLNLFKRFIENPIMILFIPTERSEEMESMLRKAFIMEKEVEVGNGVKRVYYEKNSNWYSY